ncbi:MAG: DUF3299 domain-containing protein [Flavobacteriales bacterium]|nr:DUF3299 domain-containing protein [Flavobacteriales bacterium]
MNKGITIVFLFLTSVAFGQLDVNWRELSDVTFEDKYLPDLDAYHWYPTFGEKVVALEGEEIAITGYVIPVDYESNYYILSANPYASCFFCGNAGPETVVELELKEEDDSYTTDQRLTFKGILRLNTDDIYKMNYILEEAEVYDY